MTVEEVLIKLGFDVPADKLKEFLGIIKGAVERLTSLDVAFSAAVIGAVKFVKGVIDETENFRKLGERIGATGEQVSTYVDAMALVSVPQKDAEESLTSLSLAIGRASSGLGRAQKVFEDLGVAYRDTTGSVRPTLDVLDDVRAKLSKLSSGEAEAFLERLGLGSGYAKTLKFNLAQLREEVDRVDEAVGLSNKTLFENSKVAGASWRRLVQEANLFKGAFSSAMKAMAQNVIPILAKAFENIRLRLQGLREIFFSLMRGLASRGASALQPLLVAFGFLSNVLIVVVGWLAKAAEWLVNSKSGYADLARLVLGLATAINVLNASFLKSPLFWFAALAVLIVALIDDFSTFLDGGESLFGELKTWGKIIYGLVAAGVALATAWKILSVAQGILNVVMMANPFVAITAAILALIAAGVWLYQNWDVVKEKLAAVWGGIKKAISSLGDAFYNFVTSATIMDAIEWLVKKWESFRDRLLAIWEGIKSGAKAVGEFFKGIAAPFIDSAKDMKAALANIGPVPATAGGPVLGGPVATGMVSNDNRRSSSTSVDQKINININGATNPEATGRAVQAAVANATPQSLKRDVRGGPR